MCTLRVENVYPCCIGKRGGRRWRAQRFIEMLAILRTLNNTFSSFVNASVLCQVLSPHIQLSLSRLKLRAIYPISMHLFLTSTAHSASSAPAGLPPSSFLLASFCPLIREFAKIPLYICLRGSGCCCTQCRLRTGHWRQRRLLR